MAEWMNQRIPKQELPKDKESGRKEKMIAFIAENLYLLIAAFAMVLVAVFMVFIFVKLPRAAQIEAMKEWLKYAVTWAEKELGSGTGQLKLRMVYEMFVEKFAQLAKWVSFSAFSEYVDEALVWMKEQLSNNQAVAALVSGSAGESGTYTSTSVIGFEAPTEYEDDEEIDETTYGEKINS